MSDFVKEQTLRKITAFANALIGFNSHIAMPAVWFSHVKQPSNYTLGISIIYYSKYE